MRTSFNSHLRGLGWLARALAVVALCSLAAVFLPSALQAQQAASRNTPAKDSDEAAPAISPLTMPDRAEFAPSYSPLDHDLSNPPVRLLLLTQHGPLILEAKIEVDGRPLRERWNRLVNQLLEAVDAKGEGRIAWDEALQNPRFNPNAALIQTQNSKDSYRSRFDANQNGLVEWDEASQFLQQYAQSGPLQIATQPTAAATNLRSLLDADQNQELSADEIAAAFNRLKQHDLNDDDILALAEVQRADLALLRGGRGPARINVGLVIDGSLSGDQWLAALKQSYPHDDDGLLPRGFGLIPHLFDQLDRNQNGRLAADELAGLPDIHPHLRLEVQLATAEGSSQILVVEMERTLQTEPVKNSAGVGLALRGIDLRLSFDKTTTRVAVNYASAAMNTLSQYDKDKNGYLDKSEVPRNGGAMFAAWDLDEDGKVFAKEIEDAYLRQVRPRMAQTRLMVAVDPDPLFAALDENRSGTLGARELKMAPERLLTLDANADKVLSPHELPQTIGLHFSSQLSGGFSPIAVRYYQPSSGSRPETSPSWFGAMDRNGDGDISLREFLGTAAQFERLDANRDGFIDLAEAREAEPK